MVAGSGERVMEDDPIDESSGEVPPNRFIYRINDAHLAHLYLPAGDYKINVNTGLGVVEFIRRNQ